MMNIEKWLMEHFTPITTQQPIEQEVKIIHIDVQAVKQQLVQLGAKQVKNDQLQAEYFDTPQQEFKKERSVLRIRSSGKETIITYKKKINKEKQVKTYYEKEFLAPSFEQAKDCFLAKGLLPWAHITKHRESYRLESVLFEFDTLPGIPPYLEIEGTAQEIKEWITKLGFENKQVKTWSQQRLIQKMKEVI